MDQLITKSLKLTAVAVILASLLSFYLHGWRWSAGLLIGAGWMMTNTFLIAKILMAVIHPQSQRRLYGIFLVKFPVLYLIAFGILISRAFPLISLALGSIVIFMAMGGLWLCPKRT